MGILDSIRQADDRKRLEAEQAERLKQEQARTASLEAHEKAKAAELARQSQQAQERARLPDIRAKEAGPAERLISQDNKQRMREAASVTPKPEQRPENKQERPVVATEKEHKFEPAHPQPSVGPGNFTSRAAKREGIAARMKRQEREADAAVKPEQKIEKDRPRQEQLDRLAGSKARSLVDGGRAR